MEDLFEESLINKKIIEKIKNDTKQNQISKTMKYIDKLLEIRKNKQKKFNNAK